MSLKQVFQQQRPRDKFGCKILQPHKKKKKTIFNFKRITPPLPLSLPPPKKKWVRSEDGACVSQWSVFTIQWRNITVSSDYRKLGMTLVRKWRHFTQAVYPSMSLASKSKMNDNVSTIVFGLFTVRIFIR